MRALILAKDPMDCTPTGMTTSIDQLSYPSRSVIMLARLEQTVSRREGIFGRERLLRTVAAIKESDVAGHVANYRAFIRTNVWPNHVHPTSTEVFFEEYERGAHHYVKVGFEALEYLAGGRTSDGLEQIFRRVVISEALRGQFGKRSPTGLDERLDDLVITMEEILGGLGVADIDQALTLLGTPGSSSLTAESLLMNDLRDLRSAFPEPPTIKDIIDDKNNVVAWRFLRRHCRWSIDQLHVAYVAHPAWLLTSKIEAAEEFRAHQERERVALLADLRARAASREFHELLRVAHAAVTLNHMNLALEPSYSFKGGPGLAHGTVLQIAQKIGAHTLPPPGEIHKEKWRLMSEPNLLLTKRFLR
jgi:hypothetical protein